MRARGEDVLSRCVYHNYYCLIVDLIASKGSRRRSAARLADRPPVGEARVARPLCVQKFCAPVRLGRAAISPFVLPSSPSHARPFTATALALHWLRRHSPGCSPALPSRSLRSYFHWTALDLLDGSFLPLDWPAIRAFLAGPTVQPPLRRDPTSRRHAPRLDERCVLAPSAALSLVSPADPLPLRSRYLRQSGLAVVTRAGRDSEKQE